MRSLTLANADVLGQVLKEVQKTNSEHAVFSEATDGFTGGLLLEMGYTFSAIVSTRVGGNKHKNVKFNWCQRGSLKRDEDQRTPAARDKLSTLLVLEKKNEIVDVHNNNMVSLEKGTRSAAGKTDLAIREKSKVVFKDNIFLFASAVVELKTDKASLSVCQLRLELVSLSKMSKYEQGVVVLGTDLNTKWATAHFERYNCITITTYDSAAAALDAFVELLSSATARGDRNQPLGGIDEIEGDEGNEGDEGDQGDEGDEGDEGEDDDEDEEGKEGDEDGKGKDGGEGPGEESGEGGAAGGAAGAFRGARGAGGRDGGAGRGRTGKVGMAAKKGTSARKHRSRNISLLLDPELELLAAALEACEARVEPSGRAFGQPLNPNTLRWRTKETMTKTNPTSGQTDTGALLTKQALRALGVETTAEKLRRAFASRTSWCVALTSLLFPVSLLPALPFLLLAFSRRFVLVYRSSPLADSIG
jgi:hypothetical protein